MTQLDDALSGLQRHEGVEHLLLLGGDGLLIRHLGDAAALEPETVAAMIPGIVAASGMLGYISGRGELATAVLQLRSGVVVITPLSADVVLAVLLRPGVGFSTLLRRLREERDDLAAML
jgi:predicted regulator of Ras-like GTPase activity (Roadblock/LC7/MglB family)